MRSRTEQKIANITQLRISLYVQRNGIAPGRVTIAQWTEQLTKKYNS